MPRLDIADQYPPASTGEARARRAAVRDRLWGGGRVEPDPIKQTSAASSAAPSPGAVPLAKPTPDHIEAERAIAEIVDALASHLKISTQTVLTDIKAPLAIEARRVAAALAVLWLKLPRQEVADHFGILEGTVMDGLRRVNRVLLRYAITARAPRSEAVGTIARELLSDSALTCAVSIPDIQRAVCDAFAVTPHELISARRSKSILLPRQLAMALAKHLTRRSLPDIGRQFGGRDHTTVLHAIRKVAPIMAQAQAALPPSAALADWVNALRAGVDA